MHRKKLGRKLGQKKILKISSYKYDTISSEMIVAVFLKAFLDKKACQNGLLLLALTSWVLL